jgi:hypothetical protein
MSTARGAQLQARRPTAPSPSTLGRQPCQQVVQRRAYKTVEEAKSRYKSGVRIVPFGDLQGHSSRG